MNDRFRFRAWDIEENKYREAISLGQDRSFLMNIGHVRNDTQIFEQCTGLKDKNGKLIYEGDWLKTKDGYYCYVVWFDGFWWLKSLPSEAMDLEHSEFYKECEVIGNIHENGDLLK